ncbi:hypothetical protein N7539_003232 [Penicillium diatomitis]|uniref:Uncharacterized protein n=1 Tax=Penicillium diatomitis TaxID=2819901 RepID=A0A9X0BZD0_9EURO|nr:uncharacterized protein N7539_003232 [Penicillium diatomitis]KAJ5491665.1 hypothetical protein N7539_003232 [Penicillium diatomitis]
MEDEYWKLFRDRQINDLLDLNDTPAEESSEWREIANQQDLDILHETCTATDGQHEHQNHLPIPLTNGLPEPVSATVIEHVAMLPEYPQTHDAGYAYVVNLEGLSTKQAKAAVTSFQYSYRRSGSPSPVFNAFLGCQTIKTAYRCSGVKACQSLEPSLSLKHHHHADEELFCSMATARRMVHQSDSFRLPQQNSTALYHAAKEKFLHQKACRQQNESCRLVYGIYDHPNIAGVRSHYLACYNSKSSEPGNHYHHSLVGKDSSLDIHLLKHLIDHDKPTIFQECGVIKQQSSRQPKCGVIHPQGQGKMQTHDCSVYFCTYMPLDIRTHPYAIFYSRGCHTHPPPPPNRPPWLIMDDILDLICRMQTPDLTLSVFLRSPALREFCRKYNCKTLSQIHHSFVNSDRFSAIILKQRALAYPCGRQLAGIKHELRRDPSLRLYIREISDTEHGTFIFCAFDEQIKHLASLPSFEVDMSYKRVKGPFNEVIFAVFLPSHGKIMTLLRVFTDQETPEGYQFLFQKVFSLVSDVANQPFEFHYLHGRGLKAIVSDMCPRQMTVLGKYLQTVDPQKREWQFQLQNIIVFCHNPHLKRWAEHKKHRVIAAGLCKALEQSHYKSYFLGFVTDLKKVWGAAAI